jgi:hypothetical protein
VIQFSGRNLTILHDAKGQSRLRALTLPPLRRGDLSGGLARLVNSTSPFPFGGEEFAQSKVTCFSAHM